VEAKKVCRACESVPLNDLVTVCASCGGTYFTYNRSSLDEFEVEPIPEYEKDKKRDFLKSKSKVSISILIITLFGVGLISSSQHKDPPSGQSGYWSTICNSHTDLGGNNTRTICQPQWNPLFAARKPNEKIYIARPPDENLSTTPSTSQGTSPSKASPPSDTTIQDSAPAPSVSPRPIVCKPNSNCPVGSIGPAGGLVFYDAGTKQSWGRYLEVSIKDFPEVFGWCSSSDAEGINLETSKDIGSGYSNTRKIRSKCNQDSSNAGLVAFRYASGGLSDWFIPSLDELLKLSHSVAWKEIEPIANGFPIATSTQSETDFRYEYAIVGGTFEELFGGPVVVPMVRAF